MATGTIKHRMDKKDSGRLERVGLSFLLSFLFFVKKGMTKQDNHKIIPADRRTFPSHLG